ncbi:protein phosphatase 2C domain-containing protein [Candidatus Entotheonella palauensis]|uniref:PPM-type phosphatase domain-containing protein n=1 Tax=Candidatus Entotheonella gemina TaxID=1429439 RepID=W4MC98_9BACT|nr:protein phosphatase 2C domain-containing protein [Candidatus Entotheonella palauensis]ETX07790.1 MAG: hypothetical protein ETSY2_09155 [Candidatus Entotheonella gemina]
MPFQLKMKETEMVSPSVEHHPCGPLPFDVAAGSVQGREHHRLGRNNQDAFAWHRSDRGIVAVVCDGCGSQEHSEVGAHLGARLMLGALQPGLPAFHPDNAPSMLEDARQHVLRQMDQLVRHMGGDYLDTLRDYFLFTVVGAMITPRHTMVFTLGDGLVAVNDTVTHGQYADNAPPYLAYGLLADNAGCTFPEQLRFRIRWSGRTEEVQTVLLATDGAEAFHQPPSPDPDMASDEEPVGALSQFWTDPRLVLNPQGINRRLRRLNREVVQPCWEGQYLRHRGGLLADDTTLVVIRRQPNGLLDTREQE